MVGVSCRAADAWLQPGRRSAPARRNRCAPRVGGRVEWGRLGTQCPGIEIVGYVAQRVFTSSQDVGLGFGLLVRLSG